MKRAIFILFLVKFMFLSTFLYSKGTIILSVDSTNLVVGQSTNLSVTISNISVSGKPVIKNVDKFHIIFVGTSSSISIINGNFKSTKTFSYELTPLEKGKFAIGPAIVTVSGKVYKSNKVEITVSDSPTVNKKNLKNKRLFLVVSANKRKVKLNEEIILSVKLYRRVDVYDMNIKVPDMNEFIITKLSNAREYIEAVNGKQYYVDELKYSLIPTETGKFTIPPFIIYGKVPLSTSPFDNFFKSPPFVINNYKQVSIPSNNLKITVSPLNKNVYAVGDYSFTYSIDKSKVKVGDTVTLTFKITGAGDLNFSQNLKLPNIDGLKYYPAKPKVSVHSTLNGLVSEKVEKIAIIPEKKGYYKIPKLKIIFYNPNKMKYESYFLPEINFQVLPGKENKLKVVEAAGQKIGKQKGKLSGELIDTIITDKPIIDEALNLSAAKLIIFYIFPILILLLSYLLRYFYIVRKANFKKIIQSNSFNNFKKSLIKSSSIDEISNCVKRYFSEKTGNLGYSYTFKEIIEILQKNSIEESIIRNLQEIFSIMEKIQFARAGEIEIEKLKNQLIEIISFIDKKMRF